MVEGGVMAGDCIFCRIISGDIPSDMVYSDDEVVAFRDVRPVAPTHILIVPRRHIAGINDVEEADAALVARMMLLARRLAQEEGVAQSGYRLVVNCGPDGGQEVMHLHLHLIGGRKLDDRLG